MAENARTEFIVDGKTGRGLLKAIINSMIVDGVDADHSDDEERSVTDEEPNRHGHRHPAMYSSLQRCTYDGDPEHWAHNI